MDKTIIKNYMYNLIYQLTVNLIPVLLAPYLARTLGAENLGVYSYTISISTYFVLLGSLGTSLYGKREIAYVQGDKDTISKKFYEILIIKIITMAISISCFYLLFVKNDSNYSLYYTILMMELVANIFDISWFFQGIELFKKIIIRNIIIKIISMVCIFTLVKSNQDLWIYLCIYASTILLANISLWYKMGKYINPVRLKELNIKEHIIPSLQLFIPQLAIQLYTVLDRTMIGVMIEDKSIVGFYDQAQRLITMILTIVTSLSTVMLPRIANTFAKGDLEAVKIYIYKSMKFIFFLTIPMACGMIAVSRYFIPIYLGMEFLPVIGLVNLLAIIIVFIGLSNVIGEQYLLPTKNQKQFTKSVFTGAIVNFLLNIILIGRYGAIGACIATVIAECSVVMVQLYFVRDKFKIYTIIKENYKFILAGIAMYNAITFIERSHIDEMSDFMYCVTFVFIGAVSYITLLIVMRETVIIEVLRKITKKEKQ